MVSGTENRSKIIAVGTAVPHFGSRQETILAFMQQAYQEPVASRKLNMLFMQSGIQKRYSVVPDFLNHGNEVLFKSEEEKPDIEKRTLEFKHHAITLATTAINDACKKIGISSESLGITHLITVTCTGLHAPGLDAGLIESLGFPPDIFHTSLNFLGCNAAFPALKIADTIVKADNTARVLVVCVELCTLHFQPKNNADNLLSNTIFGDGAAAVLMVSENAPEFKNNSGLIVRNFYSSLLLNGKDLMGWNLTPLNFEMILNSGLPRFLGDELNLLKEKIASAFQIQFKNVNHWAVHPGGKRVLDEVKQQLGFANGELDHSYNVLQNYGNMSSPTVLFVLSEILNNGIKKADSVLCMGFGPGISVDTALLEYAGV
jgi:predicted naringenin-chalcone synthase